MKRKPVCSRIELIDPADCGSTVAYSIVRGRRLSATVDLADCNRKIQWYFWKDGNGLKKIDKAIEVLNDFRSVWLAAVKQRPRRKR